MTLRLKLAVLGAPIPLRILLAVVFIWAALGKIVATMPVQGEQAAILANMGALKPAAPPAGGNAAGAVYTAADFPSPVDVRRVMGLALMLHGAANPVAQEGGAPTRRIWPKFLAGGRSPVILAWMVALTELLGGSFVLIGLATRLWALGLMGVMVGAMWLAEIGPAVQSGKVGFLGVLPDHPTFGQEWMFLLLQFSMFMTALTLALAGPGAAALDNLLFRRKGADAD
ncbi:MAG: DoxX family protein [Phycisphaerales bacterium]|nr:DoxX family protein [Phycisphaerales bacterium]